MVFETIALSIIALLLFMLLLSHKTGTLKLLLGLLTTVAAVAAMVCFILMQNASGNPDAGKEFLQLYLPCAAYLLITFWGIFSAWSIHRKKKIERDAKRALKESKKKNTAEE